MPEVKDIYIFGYSGHAYVVIESLLLLGYQINGYFDYSENKKNPFNLKYLGNEKEVAVKNIVGDKLVFPTVGDNLIRKRLLDFFYNNELNQTSIIDPSANISKTISVGKSTYIGKNVKVNAMAHVGSGVILNTSCIIEHECHICDGVHVAPGAVLCGNVHVAENVFIGANTVVIPNLSITKNAVVGAGSVVVKNIEQSGVYIGNPAKPRL